MTENDFRRIALGMSGAVEGAHMGHPDFRANGRIFATLRPEFASGMVGLTPEHQQEFIQTHPRTFSPEVGAWGRAGATRVLLAAAEEDAVGEAMTLAWRIVMAKPPSSRSKKPATTTKRRNAAAPKAATARKNARASKGATASEGRAAKRPSGT